MLVEDAVRLSSRQGTLVEYPQALLRELGSVQGLLSEAAIQFDEQYDATLQLSATQDWYLPTPNLKIRPEQYDLSLVVLHELVHAVGFGGVNLLPAGNNLPLLLPVAEMQSVKDRSDPNSTADVEHQFPVLRMRAPTLFESRLAVSLDVNPAGGGYLRELSQTIVSVVENAVQFPASIDAVSQALGLPEAASAATSLYSLATTRSSIVFAGDPARFPGLNATALLVMESELTPPTPGSSLAHVSHSKYAQSPEFLMTYKIPRGKTLDQLIAAHGAFECGLGPLTLEALQSLGYQIQDKYVPRVRFASSLAASAVPSTAYILNVVNVANADAHFTPLTPASGHRMPGGLVNRASRLQQQQWLLCSGILLFFSILHIPSP